MYPKVTIIWLNYNSMKFIDVALESLDSLFNINYPNYEIIVVDNNSNDGSFDVIKKSIKRKRGSDFAVKIIRLNKNIGYCGGNNAGFKARDHDSKYVIILNNDVVVFSESLRYLVEEMENDPKLGAVQGILIDYDNGYVDTAGGMMDELLNLYRLFAGLPASLIKKPYYITYAEGSFSMYRINAILDVNRSEKIFAETLFAYTDDTLLGLQLWNNKYKVKTIPVVVGKHRRSSSFGKVTDISPLRLYLMLRNKLFLISITNSKYKPIAYILNILYYLTVSLAQQTKTKKPTAHSYAIIRAIEDSYRMMKAFKGRTIDLYKAPIIKFQRKPINEEFKEYLRIMRMKYLKNIMMKLF